MLNAPYGFVPTFQQVPLYIFPLGTILDSFFTVTTFTEQEKYAK